MSKLQVLPGRWDASGFTKHGGGGTFLVPEYSYPWELQPSSVDASPLRRGVSVCRAGHQCCIRQIFHSSLAASWGRKDAKPIPQENQLQGKGLGKPWVLSSHGLPDGKDLAQGVKLKDSLMHDLEHVKVPP